MRKFFLFCCALAFSLSMVGCVGSIPAVTFSDRDFSSVSQVWVYNCHNGQSTLITEEQSILDICQFLRTLSGEASRKQEGFYEGSYSVTLTDPSSREILEIVFGDTDVFYCTLEESGEQTRFDMVQVTKQDVIRFFSGYDASGFNWE